MNTVFIAQSIDGYIADNNGGIEWLNTIPNPENIDMGYTKVMQRTDALIMGRNTFETVCGFDMEWPYIIPVFVLSNSLKTIPEKYLNKAQLINGTPQKIIKNLNSRGYLNLYIDGGKTIQSFLTEDLIDEMIITTIPILLGGGVPLFGELPTKIAFELISSEVFLNAIVQDCYKRKRTI